LNLFLWKTFKSKLGRNIWMRIQIAKREILKVFLRPPPPSERESFVGCVKLTIPKVTTLSIEKRDCEKYLLRITAWNLV